MDTRELSAESGFVSCPTGLAMAAEGDIIPCMTELMLSKLVTPDQGDRALHTMSRNRRVCVRHVTVCSTLVTCF